jgi:hypothetical protein
MPTDLKDNDRVTHSAYKDGTVAQIQNADSKEPRAVVDFDSGERKVILAKFLTPLSSGNKSPKPRLDDYPDSSAPSPKTPSSASPVPAKDTSKPVQKASPAPSGKPKGDSGAIPAKKPVDPKIAARLKAQRIAAREKEKTQQIAKATPKGDATFNPMLQPEPEEETPKIKLPGWRQGQRGGVAVNRRPLITPASAAQMKGGMAKPSQVGAGGMRSDAKPAALKAEPRTKKPEPEPDTTGVSARRRSHPEPTTPMGPAHDVPDDYGPQTLRKGKPEGPRGPKGISAATKLGAEPEKKKGAWRRAWDWLTSVPDGDGAKHGTPRRKTQFKAAGRGPKGNLDKRRQHSVPGFPGGKKRDPES